MTEENNTHHVVFQPSGRQGRVPHGITLLEAGRLLGVEIEAICGGRQTCGKCQVIVEEGEFPKHDLSSSATHLSPPDEREQRFWAERPHLRGRRLSCAACVLGDLMIGVPEESQARKQVVRKAAGSRPVTVAPPIRLYYVEIDAATLGDPLGIWDRAAGELEARFGLRDVALDPVLLPGMYRAAGEGERAFTLTVWQGRQVVRVQPGYHEQALGIAADIGTTTIALHLCDLLTGEVLATASQMNPQVSYGEDLMSRVSFCDIRPDGLALLHGAAIAALNRLAGDAAAEAGIDQAAITDAVLVGNTVMHHILLNIPPSALGYSPFEPAISDAVDIKARDFGLSIAPAGWVHLLPIEAGHVGADNVGVLLAEEPHHAPADEVWLVVDVGTNGELLLGNRERLYSASSPTGPAFEGAQIRHGMRAAPGAIERVRIDPETLEVNFRIIGRGPWSRDWQDRPGHKALLATGICGSGIIEAVAELFLAGVLTPNGRFVRGVRSPRMLREGPHAEFVLAWADQSGTGSPIVITAGDVRAIQLAKAALYSGARLLMERFGTLRVDRIALAGAFGNYIDPLHAMVLGMIPDCDLRRVESIGNAAGDGARVALLNAEQRNEARRLARWVQYVGISLEPRFQDAFVEAIPLPHDVDRFPHIAELLEAAASRRAARMVDERVAK